MTANVENSIEFARLGQDLRQFLGLGPERLVLVQEFDRNRIIFECFSRASIKGGFASIRGSDYQFGLIFQDLIWMGKLGLFSVSKNLRAGGVHWLATHQVPSGGLVVGWNLILGGENDQDLRRHSD